MLTPPCRDITEPPPAPQAHLLLRFQTVGRGLDPPRLLPAHVRLHEAGDAQGARVAEAPHEDAVLPLGRLPRVLEDRGGLLGLPQLADAPRARRFGQAPAEGRRRPPHSPQRPPHRRRLPAPLRPPPPSCRPLTRDPQTPYTHTPAFAFY
uniref:Uncharacterized protein n=1 Tax=Aquila chrysaetos chrysaetos TaxID=223781 RepID=A0A663ERM7_AQUCH